MDVTRPTTRRRAPRAADPVEATGTLGSASMEQRTPSSARDGETGGTPRKHTAAAPPTALFLPPTAPAQPNESGGTQKPVAHDTERSVDEPVARPKRLAAPTAMFRAAATPEPQNGGPVTEPGSRNGSVAGSGLESKISANSGDPSPPRAARKRTAAAAEPPKRTQTGAPRPAQAPHPPSTEAPKAPPAQSKRASKAVQVPKDPAATQSSPNPPATNPPTTNPPATNPPATNPPA